MNSAFASQVDDVDETQFDNHSPVPLVDFDYDAIDRRNGWQEEEAVEAKVATMASALVRIMRWVLHYDNKLHVAKTEQPTLRMWALLWSIAPGQLDDSGRAMSQTELARRLGVPKQRLSECVVDLRKAFGVQLRPMRPRPEREGICVHEMPLFERAGISLERQKLVEELKTWLPALPPDPDPNASTQITIAPKQQELMGRAA